MSVIVTGRKFDMARTRPRAETPPEDDGPRDRIDLRIDPALYTRIKTAAIRILGEPNMSAYIRMAVIERLAKDEAPKE